LTLAERHGGLEDPLGLASGYRQGWLASNLVAGLIAWSVVPQPVAFAQLAGLRTGIQRLRIAKSYSIRTLWAAA
jgi:hypothetical protein